MRTTRQPRTRRRQMVNRLNDLTPREWIKFQKSWFVHNPPPREPGVLTHPAKFPETLAREFVEFFTKRGEWVLDPMVGTGSTLLAARAAGRPSIGVELSEPFARLARERLADLAAADDPASAKALLLVADARHLAALNLPPIAYCLTSPPYWDMLHRPGFETQDGRRARGLSVTYSDSPHDLGNIDDYETFLDALCAIYTAVHAKLRPRAYLTVIVKNVKKGGKIYPLAWDLARRLSAIYALKDERIWLQDNVRLAPYGLFNAWVSNTHHHYCLTFRKE
jgi:DNA modification methylase